MPSGAYSAHCNKTMQLWLGTLGPLGHDVLDKNLYEHLWTLDIYGHLWTFLNISAIEFPIKAFNVSLNDSIISGAHCP